MMYAPQKIRPFFSEVISKRSNILCGTITCCNSDDFEILYYGNIYKNITGKKKLYNNKDGLILYVRCKKCNRIIKIFNSFSDGYDNYIEKNTEIEKELLSYDKHDVYSIKVTFEYPDIEELMELNIDQPQEAFTWIFVSIKNKRNNKVIKNFVSYETG